jgi:peptidoglycan/LPS O-acetylase OafA/YrhL
MSPIRSLDGLRGLAAIIVVLAHFNLVTPKLLHGLLRDSGHAGVMIFFVLSGFLMGHLYLEGAPTKATIAHFLVRRFARVIPLYVLVVLASFALLLAAPGSHIWVYPIRSGQRLIEHLAMIRGIGVLWSVPVEIQFYALVPVIWIAFSKAPRATLLGLLAIIAGTHLYLAATGWQPVSDAPILTELPYFLAGLVISRCVRPGIGGRGWDILFLIALASLALLYPKLTQQVLGNGAVWWSNPLGLVVASVLLLACLRSRLAEMILGSPPFRFLGRVSYGIYLLHFVVISNIIRFFPDLHGRKWILLIVCLAATLIAAQLAHVLIERPARDAINRWFDRRTPRLAKQAV